MKIQVLVMPDGGEGQTDELNHSEAQELLIFGKLSVFYNSSCEHHFVYGPRSQQAIYSLCYSLPSSSLILSLFRYVKRTVFDFRLISGKETY